MIFFLIWLPTIVVLNFGLTLKLPMDLKYKTKLSLGHISFAVDSGGNHHFRVCAFSHFALLSPCRHPGVSHDTRSTNKNWPRIIPFLPVILHYPIVLCFSFAERQLWILLLISVVRLHLQLAAKNTLQLISTLKF